MSIKKIVIYAVLVILGTIVMAEVITISCRSSAVKQFKKSMQEGNLTEAEQCLERIDYSVVREPYALRLIRVYLELDKPKQAIHVYEDLTPNHLDREWLGDYGEYSADAAKLLREYLVKHEDYETAWNYYPLRYSKSENYVGNASSFYTYVKDVVEAMCAKGKQDEAIKFLRFKLDWFKTYVDADDSSEYKAFRSDQVRERLEQLVEASYH